jgi:hypothetical protein
MKLLIMQFSLPSHHSIPLWSKYSPQHPVLKHPQFMFLSTSFNKLIKINCSAVPCYGLFVVLVEIMKHDHKFTTQAITLSLWICGEKLFSDAKYKTATNSARVVFQREQFVRKFGSQTCIHCWHRKLPLANICTCINDARRWWPPWLLIPPYSVLFIYL